MKPLGTLMQKFLYQKMRGILIKKWMMAFQVGDALLQLFGIMNALLQMMEVMQTMIWMLNTSCQIRLCSARYTLLEGFKEILATIKHSPWIILYTYSQL